MMCRLDELSHYSAKTYDLMYEFPHGKEELEGIANRTDFDLGSHSQNQEALKINAKINIIQILNQSLLFKRKWRMVCSLCN